MSKEIHLSYEAGNNLYAIVRRPSDGKVWDVAGSAWATWSDGNIDNYDIALTDKSGDFYTADFPTHANVGSGQFEVSLFLRAGASPATSDNLIAKGNIIWTGTGELTAEKILTNKAIQTKSTGVIQHYDDDGSTVLRTLTPTDGASTITLTPS